MDQGCTNRSAATYPEWIRYDGFENPLYHWSTAMVARALVSSSGGPRNYFHYREVYEQTVAEISPSYVKAMCAGRQIREVLDWAEKLANGDDMTKRIAVVNRWIDSEDKAAGLGVALPTVFHTKSYWLSHTLASDERNQS